MLGLLPGRAQRRDRQHDAKDDHPPNGVLDHRMVDRLEDYAASTGSCRDAAAGESAYPVKAGEARLGRWLAQTRRTHREGLAEKSVSDRLSRLPGWTWEPLSPTGRAGVEALAASLYIMGFREQAVRALSKFSWGEQFLKLNQEPLDRYSEVETSAEVVRIQMEYLPHERPE